MSKRNRGPTARWTVSAGAGFSLVEVVVALGLLGGVLVSLVGTFVLAGRVLRGGARESAALAVAAARLETLDGWGFRETWERLGCRGDRTSCTVDDRAAGWPAEWHAGTASGIPGARETLEVRAVGAGSLSRAAFVQVRIAVAWAELGRERKVVLCTVRG